jgi:hypothetical protein
MVSHAFICADTNTKWFPGRANRKWQQSIEKITLLKTHENEMAAGVLGSRGSAAQTVSELWITLDGGERPLFALQDVRPICSLAFAPSQASSAHFAAFHFCASFALTT